MIVKSDPQNEPERSRDIGAEMQLALRGIALRDPANLVHDSSPQLPLSSSSL